MLFGVRCRIAFGRFARSPFVHMFTCAPQQHRNVYSSSFGGSSGGSVASSTLMSGFFFLPFTGLSSACFDSHPVNLWNVNLPFSQEYASMVADQNRGRVWGWCVCVSCVQASWGKLGPSLVGVGDPACPGVKC